MVTVSKAEAEEINKFLNRSWKAKEYGLAGRFSCSNCGRVLTFYDVFQSGRRQHGDELLKRILGGDEFHLQVAKRGQTIDIECTACHTLNRFGMKIVSRHKSYWSKQYCYA
jgi:hypothetical protein